ncbi:hypothetical protein [Kitasatospora sp. NPDC094015]|uniref:hypothetical protein n=1 Tax=Kitasatospora sp. NPDC094015 TaxID=3155205 RepID=UPI003330DA1B
MPVTTESPTSRAAARDVRLVRAAAFATASVTLASAAHGVTGGPLGPGQILCGWLVLWVAAAAGTGRERTLPAITAATIAAQVTLHLLFSAGHILLTPPAARLSAHDMAGMPDMPGMDMGPGAAGHVHATLLPAAGGLAHAQGHAGLFALSPGMIVGHAAAALATGWLLHRFETALWRLLRLARTVRDAVRRWQARVADILALLAGHRTPLPACPAGGRRLSGARVRRIGPLPLRHTLIRRGPPGGVSA